MTEYFSTSKLLNRPFDDCLEFDNNGIIIDDFKHKINDPTLNLQDSKIIGNPEDKFETMLFLPNNHERKGEGGLRTKGYFKHSYKYIESDCKNNNEIIPHENKIETSGWYIIDSNDKPLKLASTEIQQKIANYISNIKIEKDNSIKTVTPENIVYLPLISVITVVYNGAKYLEETILSILNQSYPNIEYIIIDGGSTDNTLDIIKKYENYIDYWISEPDNGIYDAMNKGIKIANGEWINFMNCGDFFYENTTIDKFVTQLYNDENQYISVYYGSVELRYKNKKSKISRPKKIDQIWKGMIFCHQSAFIKTSEQKKYLYNPKYKLSADFDFFYALFNANKKFRQIDIIVSSIDMSGISNTQELKVINEYSQIVKSTFVTKIYYYYRKLIVTIKRNKHI